MCVCARIGFPKARYWLAQQSKKSFSSTLQWQDNTKLIPHWAVCKSNKGKINNLKKSNKYNLNEYYCRNVEKLWRVIQMCSHSRKPLQLCVSGMLWKYVCACLFCDIFCVAICVRTTAMICEKQTAATR